MTTRIDATETQINNTRKLENETIVVPTFPYLWKQISPKFAELQLESKILHKLKKSVDDLPTILQPLLSEPATIENIAQAKILFLQYAIQIGINKKMASSKQMRNMYQLTTMELRQHIDTFFNDQIKIMETYTKPTGVQKMLANKSVAEYLKSNAYWTTNPTAKAAIASGEATIGQLLIIDPTIFYSVPGME